MPAMLPLHLMRWIVENPHFFKPPVANREVFPESEFIFQIIRGPNARNDFHIDPGDEIFYQLKGDITLQYMDGDGKRREARIREGEVMLCPAGTPHCPVRPADTWGLVIERKRRPNELDRLAWFCERCETKIHEVTFSCENIETQLKEAIEAFNRSSALRTCERCGVVLPVPAGP